MTGDSFVDTWIVGMSILLIEIAVVIYNTEPSGHE